MSVFAEFAVIGAHWEVHDINLCSLGLTVVSCDCPQRPTWDVPEGQ